MSPVYRCPSSSAGRPVILRILIAIQALENLGGKERDALAIAGGLAARGHTVSIATRSARLTVPAEVTLRLVDAGAWSNHGRARRFAVAIAELRSSEDFDAVLSFEKLQHADVYYAADVCFARRKLGVRGLLPRYARYRRLERACFGPAGPDNLFLCRAQADEYQRHYRIAPDRASILPPMIHPTGRRDFYARRAEIRQEFGIPETATLAVSVAVYAEQKGIDRSVAALREIPDLHLLAVGLKNDASIKALAAELNLTDRVRLCGHRDDIPDILGAADLMLHPARLENTGLVILEGMLAGVPVIASGGCGFAEYIVRFGAGTVLSEPFDAAEYVAAIRAALRPDRLAELRQSARASAPQLLAEGGLDPILDVVERALARRRQRSR